MGDGLPVRFDLPVTRIDHGDRVLRIETTAGTIETDLAVIAVPTPVLASGALALSPALPDKQEAAGALPFGLANEASRRGARGRIARGGSASARKSVSGDTGSYRLLPFGFPVLEAFLGGAVAEALERAGSGATTAFAIEELVHLLGKHGRGRLSPLAETGWRGTPWIGGAYPYARVGARSARAMLAAPADERLFFAGEATSPYDFTTAHGAWTSGLVAGEAALAALGADGRLPAR